MTTQDCPRPPPPPQKKLNALSIVK